MSVLDWSLSRKKSNLSKFYKIVDVINMSEEESFALVLPDKPVHGTLRRIKSLNDLLGDNGDNQPTRSGSGEISTKQPDVPSTTTQPVRPANQTEQWSDQLSQRGAKKPTGKFIVSGFSTLSRRAGGGMEVPDINMQAIRVFLRNGTHKTIRTNSGTTCKEILHSVLKKIGLQESMLLYGLYIQYAISDGRIAQDDENISNINPNTWDSVTRIYLCRREEFTSARTRSRCVSFARDFLEIEQNKRTDSNFAYDVSEFTNIQKHIQVSTERGRKATVAIHKSSIPQNMVTNKLIVESFAKCWANANRQLNISNGDDYIESGVNFKTAKTLESSKRKFSASIGTINRSYTIERGKERRPALAKMLSTGSLETSSQLLKFSGIAASPLLQNVNVNSNNSNSNLLVPCRVRSMVNLGQHSQAKLDVHPFARTLEHSFSLPVISTVSEEDDEIYSTPSVSSLSQSDKSELLHKLSPFSSFSNLDLHSIPRKGHLHKDKANAVVSRLDSNSDQNLKSQLPKSPVYQNCLLAFSTSLPSLATNKAINTSSDIINTNKQHTLEVGTNKTSTETGQLFPIKKPIRTTLSVPPSLPPRKHLPTTYNTSTLPINRPRMSFKSELSSSTTSEKQENFKQHNDREASDSIGQMPNCNGRTNKLRRRRSISLSDLRSSLEKKSIKLTSMCNMETLRKAAAMKIPATKSRQVPHQKLVKQPADYQNVSIKELMAIRATVTSPTFNLQSSTGPNAVTIRPKPPDNVSNPPIVPKRHSSLFMSSSSDEEIILQYKQMSNDSCYGCQDIEMALDSSKCDADSKHNTSTFDDDVLYALADQRATKPTTRQDTVHPVSSSMMHSNPGHDVFVYDHLDFNRSTATDCISNTAVTKIDRQSEIVPQDYKKAVLDQSLVEHPVVSQSELFSLSSNYWLTASTDNHYNTTIHFDQKQETCNRPYNILQDVIKSQYSTLRLKTATLKKPSCSHIYEDIGSDYEDIDDDDDNEDYVVMEYKATTSVPPLPSLPPSFSKNVDASKTRQQQVTHLSNKQNNITKTRLVSVSSSSFEKPTSKAVKNPVEPQIKIMVGTTIKAGQSLNFQDELKHEIQTRNPETHKQLDSQRGKIASSTIQSCQASYCHNSSIKISSAVSKQVDGEDTKPSELEAKFLPMKSTHDARKQMIEKTESNLVINNNATK